MKYRLLSMSRLYLSLGCVILTGLMVAAEIMPSWGQVIIQGNLPNIGDGSIFETVDLHSDRTLSRGIERARDRIAQGEYSQAIRFLDEVLSGDSDVFVEIDDGTHFAGVKRTASSLIRDLPPDGRRLYESMFGALAERKLREAMHNGSFGDLRQVARHYFYTPAGYRAALLVARQEADCGHHRLASMLYQELLDCEQARHLLDPELSLLATQSLLAIGNSERAATLLESVQSSPRSQGRNSTVVAGTERLLRDADVTWFQTQIGVPQLIVEQVDDNWLMSGGDSSRNGRSGGGLPHMRVRWQARLLSHPQLESAYNQLVDMRIQHGKPLPTAGTTLAIGNVIVTATPHNVVAVDFHTGKRIWQTQPQRVGEFGQLGGSEDSGVDLELEAAQAFSRRLWSDYQYNSISSDGQRVYVLRDLTRPQFNEQEIWGLGIGRGGFGDGRLTVANRLCAYDLATQGKLVWEIDGAVTTGELAGSYFLGAPVAVGDTLYCLAEIKSSIHLVAIDRESGRLLSLQQLADLHRSVELDPQRRLQAIMPSYDAGILVCPTGAGVVIGVNLDRASISWYYSYETTTNPYNPRRQNRRRPANTVTEWLDGPVLIADGRVLLAPPEADDIHCLDLITGKLMWKQTREDGMFIAGVQAGKVLVVGNQNVRLYSLADGRPLWQGRSVELTEAVPTGRGFFNDDRYFLPLSNAEVVAIDLNSGLLQAKALSRSHDVLGNLIAHQGSILSHNGVHLECFDQIDVLRRRTEQLLAENPDNHEALRTLGEIKYNKGLLAESIDLLQRSYTLAPEDLQTKEVLGECLLDAVAHDFAAYRDLLPQLRSLLNTSPEKQLTLRRIEAAGTLQMDQPWESFETCLTIYTSTADLGALVPIELNYVATTACWLRAQMSAIWTQADVDTRQRITTRLIALRDKELQESGTLGPYFLECFGGVGDVFAAESIQVARDFAANGEMLAAQHWYLDLARRNENAQFPEAVASCSRILHERGFGLHASGFDRHLAGDLANVPCLNGRTGSEVLSELSPPPSSRLDDWPYGHVAVEDTLENSAERVQRRQNPVTEAKLERSDGVLERCNVFFSARVGEVTIRDRLGNEVFHHTLGEEERQLFNSQGLYGISRGNLLIVSMGQQITAIDTFAKDDESSDCILWRKNVRSTAGNRRYINQYTGRRGNGRNDRPGSLRTPRAQLDDKWVGVLGPLSRDCFVYQDQRGLHGVDPLTGKTRWSRSDAPNACNLFGDDHVVVAVLESGQQASLYHPQDGRSLGEIELPPWNEQLCSRGAELIVWRHVRGVQFELASLDPLSGTVNWRKYYQSGSQVDVELNRYVAIVEPNGRYVVVDLDTATEVVEYHSEPLASVRPVHLFCGTDTLIVAVERPSGVASEPRRAWFNNNFDYRLFEGDIMAFDLASGAALWPRPAEVRQQALIMSQPVDLPVLAFVGQYRGQDRSGTKALASAMLLEKASGRVLYADDAIPNQTNYCFVSADPAAHVVKLDMATRTVSLNFTGQPRAPEPPATFEAEGEEKQGPQGLYRIIQLFGSGN